MPATTIVCRTCMLEMELPEGMTLLTCPACGTNNSRPQVQGMDLDVLRRATQQRLRCDFAGAEDSYQYVLRSSPDEHEALWGLVLCRYGVEYVEDAARGRRLPVVHSVRRRPMSTDPDFTLACELAPAEVRQQYEQEAAYVDRAMGEILRLSEDCPPYDVFLCHKTTDPDGDLTQDYSRAFSLYHRLTMLGYRVFFAPEELKNAAGAAYEAGIYHALNTSRVMLVLCSRADFLASPWVRSEWQRFLEMSYEENSNKHLIPLIYDGLSPRRLPVDFRQLQVLTMDELDATETLLSCIRKYVGRQEPPAPAPQPVPTPQPAPVRPAPQPAPVPPRPIVYAPASDFTCTPVAGGCRIDKYKGNGGDVHIPPTLDGLQVISIGENLFHFSNVVKHVTLPEGLTHISRNAFTFSSLTGVTLPRSLKTIDECAFFYARKLEEVHLPAGLQNLGKLAFGGCESLKRITIPEGVRSLGPSALSSCKSLTALHLPASLSSIGENALSHCSGLRSITVDAGNTAFHTRDGVLFHRDGTLVCCPAALELTEYALPADTTAIAARAFSDCAALHTLHLSRDLKSVGELAFSGCENLRSVTVAVGNQDFRIYDGVLFHRDGTLVYFPRALACAKYTIPDGTKQIGEYAFFNCEHLCSVRFPASVEVIRRNAFSSCKSLLSIHFTEGLLTIGREAFTRCSALSRISLPESLTDLEDEAFQDCFDLTEVRIPEGTASIGDKIFGSHKGTGRREYGDYPEKLKLLVIEGSPAHRYARKAELNHTVGSSTRKPATAPAPAKSSPAPAAAPSDKDFMIRDVMGGVEITLYTGNSSDVRIPETISGKTVVGIGEEAFKNRSGLTSVTFPRSVSYIGDCAFWGCSSLKSVTIPDSVTSLGNFAFAFCTSLKDVTLPDHLRSLGKHAFKDCPWKLPMGMRLKNFFGHL